MYVVVHFLKSIVTNKKNVGYWKLRSHGLHSWWVIRHRRRKEIPLEGKLNTFLKDQRSKCREPYAISSLAELSWWLSSTEWEWSAFSPRLRSDFLRIEEYSIRFIIQSKKSYQFVQILALRWVKDEIGNFGGDSNRYVTGIGVHAFGDNFLNHNSWLKKIAAASAGQVWLQGSEQVGLSGWRIYIPRKILCTTDRTGRTGHRVTGYRHRAQRLESVACKSDETIRGIKRQIQTAIQNHDIWSERGSRCCLRVVPVATRKRSFRITVSHYFIWH